MRLLQKAAALVAITAIGATAAVRMGDYLSRADFDIEGAVSEMRLEIEERQRTAEMYRALGITPAMYQR